MLAWRYRIIRTPVFGFASTLYIIPSLALFAILGPITGFVASYTTAEIALVGYTLLILIWNTVAGLDAVPADAREAATALGYSKTAALIRVDLPLALPYIFAGLRVATATVIGLVTVTALIGLGRTWASRSRTASTSPTTRRSSSAWCSPSPWPRWPTSSWSEPSDLLVPWGRSRRRAQAGS